ncbi:MAG: protein kinase [Planctomycetes bacterium]|nr:protein kinase [Planctomycetota bacterium]
MRLHIQDLQTGVCYPCRVDVPLRVGRDDAEFRPDIPCTDPHVSRRHCELRLDASGRLQVTDTSSYGTFISGRRVTASGWAGAGDRIVLGHEYALAVVQSAPVAHQTQVLAPKALPRTELSVPNTPHLIGKYEVIREVGRGGMGIVYQGRCTETGREVALKVLRGVTEAEVEARFEREARLAASLGDYPAIVKVHDWGVAGPNVLFLAMDFVDGKSLSEAIKDGLDVRLGVKLVARVARAVHFAHEEGVIHRDLKPDNILVTNYDQVRLTDFGIAKESGSEITMTGTAMGTPNYMAPEQLVDSKRAGPAADIYGLGGLLYSVLTKRPPIVGKNISKIIRQIQSGRIDPPRVWCDSIDEGLEEICIRALCFDPERRQESADAFARELEAWLKQGSGDEVVKLRLPGS